MDFLIPSLSSYSSDVDWLIILITALVGFWFLAAEGMFFWLLFRFRHKEGVPALHITGKEKHLKRWINIPHYLILVCDIFIIVGAIQVWAHIKQELPPANATVRVIGQQWSWVFVHPGPDGILDTADDIPMADELHVEVDKTYHFELQATDVLHSFSVPVFRLKQDAIPGRSITGWFKATKTGAHDVQCTEICGIGHGAMVGRIFIESAEQHASWMRQSTAFAATTAGNE